MASSSCGFDILPKTVYAGVLNKKGQVNKAWKKRWFCLREINGDTILQYYENKCNKKPNGFINISDVYDMQVISHHDLLTDNLPKNININMTTKSDKKYSFQMYTKIKTKKRTYSFAALDITTFTKWINILHKYIYTATIKHGWLYKRGHRNTEWKNRYFTLNDNNQIKYYSDFEQTDICGTIDLKQITTIKNRNDVKYPYMFELITQHRTWVLRAENETDRESWICEIKKQKHAQPTLTRMTAIETYSKLINMDFDEKTCLEAASKHPDDINKALSWTITNQLVNKTVDSDEEVRQMFKNQTHKKRNKHHIRSASDRSYLDRFRSIPNKYDFIQNVSVINNDECKSIESCNAVQRIISVLKIYKSDMDMKKQKRLDLGTTMSRILNDYHHILETHLNEDVMETHKCNQEFASIHRKIIENELCCDISKCFIYLRNHRNREKGVVQTDEDLCLYDILDCIHCYFIHSVDFGFRMIVKPPIDDKNDSVAYDAEFASLKAYLSPIKKNLETIKTKNRLSNKFITETKFYENSEESKEEKNEENNVSYCCKDGEYNFGQHFEYWNGSKKPKYSTLKIECLNNEIYAMNINTFYKFINKAYIHTQTYKAKKMKAADMGSENMAYEVPVSLNISISHILVLLMYCNLDELQKAYKGKGCIEMRYREDLRHIMKRNMQIGHWYQFLYEVIAFYGCQCTPEDVFYIGMNMRVVFATFTPTFTCPMRTTVEITVAHHQCNTSGNNGMGVIIQLIPYPGCRDMYYDTEWISNYPREEERLFFSAEKLQIIDIQSFSGLKRNINADYVCAFTLLSNILNGIYFVFSLKKKKKK
eukprot:470822_1